MFCAILVNFIIFCGNKYCKLLIDSKKTIKRKINIHLLISPTKSHKRIEWMIEKGGIPYFEKLAIERSNLLYDLIDNSNGFYRTFVTDPKYRSRMQVVFTIKTGVDDNDMALVEEFLNDCNDNLGWLDIRSHPLGLKSDVIRVTMYNHQTLDTIIVVRNYMHKFMHKYSK